MWKSEFLLAIIIQAIFLGSDWVLRSFDFARSCDAFREALYWYWYTSIELPYFPGNPEPFTGAEKFRFCRLLFIPGAKIRLEFGIKNTESSLFYCRVDLARPENGIKDIRLIGLEYAPTVFENTSAFATLVNLETGDLFF